MEAQPIQPSGNALFVPEYSGAASSAGKEGIIPLTIRTAKELINIVPMERITTRIMNWGYERSPLELWITVTIHEHVENPTDSTIKPMDRYKVLRMTWTEFKNWPVTADVLDQREWETIESLAPENAKRSWWRICVVYLRDNFCCCLRIDA